MSGFTDCLGNEIEVGDSIVVACGGYGKMRMRPAVVEDLRHTPGKIINPGTIHERQGPDGYRLRIRTNEQGAAARVVGMDLVVKVG